MAFLLCPLPLSLPAAAPWTTTRSLVRQQGVLVGPAGIAPARQCEHAPTACRPQSSERAPACPPACSVALRRRHPCKLGGQGCRRLPFASAPVSAGSKPGHRSAPAAPASLHSGRRHPEPCLRPAVCTATLDQPTRAALPGCGAVLTSLFLPDCPPPAPVPALWTTTHSCVARSPSACSRR